MTSAAQTAKKARDPIDQLTLAELDSGNRLLKADIVTAVSQATIDRWQALAIVAFLLERRDDPQAKLEPFRQMTPTQITEHLGIGDKNDEETDDESDPSESQPVSS